MGVYFDTGVSRSVGIVISIGVGNDVGGEVESVDDGEDDLEFGG